MERKCSNSGCGAEIIVNKTSDVWDVRINIEKGRKLCDECERWLKEVVG